ncbi:hypothetical protein [Legionella sp.]|uniref:hypothetical protein n=1 Tax=Legionella sp. TaxID=459 RepID=UPI003C84CACB
MYFNLNQKNYYSLEKPIHELMALNMRTLQNLSYIHLSDWLNIHNPEKLLEMNVDAWIQNGHHMLDYWQEAYSIMEKSMLIVSYDILEQNYRAIPQTSLLEFGRVAKDTQRSQRTDEKKKTKTSPRVQATAVKKVTKEHHLRKKANDDIGIVNNSEKAERKNL